MLCERHGLAAGPDGECVLCQRERAASKRAAIKWEDRRVRLLARVVIGIVAGLAVFALLLATCDSKKPAPHDGAPASRSSLEEHGGGISGRLPCFRRAVASAHMFSLG